MFFPLEKKSIDIDLSNKCGLACPGCQRQKDYGGKQFQIPGKDITMSDLEKIIDFFDEIVFGGRISDPLYHPDFYNILKMCSKYTEKKFTIKHASVIKDRLFYKKCFLLSKVHNNMNWTFALDGLPEKSHIYRKNQNGSFLFEIMKLCAQFKIHTTWDYIIFKYNEDDVEICKKLAEDNNMIFNPVLSGRYWEGWEEYIPKNKDNYAKPYYYVGANGVLIK